jgi:preprotein translocase subunit Sec61beta
VARLGVEALEAAFAQRTSDAAADLAAIGLDVPEVDKWLRQRAGLLAETAEEECRALDLDPAAVTAVAAAVGMSMGIFLGYKLAAGALADDMGLPS